VSPRKGFDELGRLFGKLNIQRLCIAANLAPGKFSLEFLNRKRAELGDRAPSDTAEDCLHADVAHSRGLFKLPLLNGSFRVPPQIQLLRAPFAIMLLWQDRLVGVNLIEKGFAEFAGAIGAMRTLTLLKFLAGLDCCFDLAFPGFFWSVWQCLAEVAAIILIRRGLLPGVEIVRGPLDLAHLCNDRWLFTSFSYV